MEELVLSRIKKHMLDECVDLFIETFTKEPWNDIYESREQVVRFLVIILIITILLVMPLCWRVSGGLEYRHEKTMD